ncbi:MAG: hypothetical protein A2538_02490 [Candidatus Magasanikbacteria bacterium RIFOXYD2_FULL_41_14]|uniref:N-acetyltransferase domain-containing protein n=1 Tax=Candidatus Magasanikbacteria bacterium RIFOXYD2_FULL_41_14 TaxID=1798709 RepID=A0A1F6PC49_9BACT|nr:MAG: hypothetical protein A2538_02490 [Candidatus Magasanikbacteria bacterium RIFOXYD2_FULL_41_14]
MEFLKNKRNDTYSVQIIAKDGDSVAGWAFLVVIKNDRHDEPYGLLENLYVEKEHRNLGLGSKLVNAVITEAKNSGCYKLLATTRFSKTKVQSWYKKIGFSDHGTEFRMDLIKSEPKQSD